MGFLLTENWNWTEFKVIDSRGQKFWWLKISVDQYRSTASTGLSCYSYQSKNNISIFFRSKPREIVGRGLE